MRNIAPFLVAVLIGCTQPERPSMPLVDAVTAKNAHQVELNLYWCRKDGGCDLNAALGEGADSSSSGDMAPIIKMLLDAGANINAPSKYDHTPLGQAALSDEVETAKMLLGAGADVNAVDEKGMTALHWAGKSGLRGWNVAKILIAAGAVIDARDKDGNTPLHSAAANYSHETAKLLVAAGAKVDAQNHAGNRPMRLAAIGRYAGSNSEVYTLLRAAGGHE